MSPRAACRLEQLGYGPVHDYVAGKVDWLAAGLPTVRAEGGERRAADVMERDVATCDSGMPLSAVASGTELVVVAGDGVVLGRIPEDLDRGRFAEPDTPVVEVMRPGPSTVRANEPLEPLLERMADRDVPAILVTTPEGRLLGRVRGASPRP